jgi:Uma2 family endonuclease
MAHVIQHRHTPEEYLTLERQAEYKSEYLDGQIYAMTGASREHNVITLNTAAELRAQLRGRPCEVYAADMRVKVSETGLYTYPDVVAVCGDRRFEDAHVDTLLNPTVFIEVLSESTEAYDRGRKSAQYRRLESLAEYVLIAQDRMHVECYSRQGEHWVLTEVSEPDGSFTLQSLAGTLRLRDIYERIEFPDAER